MLSRQILFPVLVLAKGCWSMVLDLMGFSVGYLTHLEADWRDVLRTANEISIAHGFNIACRAPDLLHVAYASELAAEMIVSFDEDQLALAKATGLKAVHPDF